MHDDHLRYFPIWEWRAVSETACGKPVTLNALPDAAFGDDLLFVLIS
jgi:hypothetical protein